MTSVVGLVVSYSRQPPFLEGGCMTLDSDILIDRRRLKRRLTVWRVLAIVAIVAALAFAASRDDQTGSAFNLCRDHIARITVSGFIGDSRPRHELFIKLRKSRHVKAGIV